MYIYCEIATKYLIRLKNCNNIGEIFKIYENIFCHIGIEIKNLYTPLHFKEEYNKNNISLMETEKITKFLIQVPLEPSISDKEFNIIKDKIKDVIRKRINED